MELILAIETSCDETSVAVIKNGQDILSNIVSSQIKTHKKYGGVVPEVASRMHTECIHVTIQHALSEANVSLSDLTAIAVTMGPGLEGCLLVGISVAKTLACSLSLPLIPVNHLHGHIYAYNLKKQSISYPCLALLVSGGHTEFILMETPHSFKRCGKTRDDAAGEAFDKVARYLDLGYPGGPVIESTAKTGNPNAFPLPITMKHAPLEFSFSGLKTATLTLIDSLPSIDDCLPDICASFQHTVIQTLVSKSLSACSSFQVKSFIVAGGVSANQTLQKAFHDAFSSSDTTLHTISPKLCTDNAAMIGLASYHLRDYYGHDLYQIKATPNLNL